MHVSYKLLSVFVIELSQTNKRHRWWWRQLCAVTVSSSAGNYAVGISAAESLSRLRSSQLEAAACADDRRIWRTAAAAAGCSERSAGASLRGRRRDSVFVQDSCGQYCQLLYLYDWMKRDCVSIGRDAVVLSLALLLHDQLLVECRFSFNFYVLFVLVEAVLILL